MMIQILSGNDNYDDDDNCDDNDSSLFIKR